MNPLFRSRRGLVLPLFCVVAWVQALPARALPIAIDEQERSVAVEAAASTNAANDADSDTDSSLLPGLASLLAGAVAAVDGAGGDAGADQQGDVSTLQLTGEGSVSSYAQAPATDGFALASADTIARIVFTATSDSLLRLSGRIEAIGYDGPGDASALIELAAVDSTLDPLLLIFEVGPGESIDIDTIAMLHAGIEYRLLALARSNGDALDGEEALFTSMFQFALMEVPEPGAASGLAALAGLVLAARCRVIRQRRAPVPE